MTPTVSFREHLTPEREDDLSFARPGKPSELRTLSDEELSRLIRKEGFANGWPIHPLAEHEMSARLIASLRDFKHASDRSSRLLLVATVALVGLTLVLVGLTVVLVWLTMRLE